MSGPLWLRSVQRRPHIAVLLCLLSAVAVMTSVLGPLLVRAVQQSTLSDALEASGLPGTSISVSGDAGADDPWLSVEDLAVAAVEAGRQAAPQQWEDPQVLTRSTSLTFSTARTGAAPTAALVNAVDGDCGAFRLTEGRCPAAPGQAMLSTADATAREVAVGDRLSFSLARVPRTTVTVVGLYDADGSATAGLTRPGTTAGVAAGVEADPLVLSRRQAEELPLPVEISVRLALRPGLAVGDVPVVQASVEQLKTATNAQDRLLAVQSQLPEVLDRVDDQASAARVLVLVTDVQAVFLALFALAIVLQRIGRTRAGEWSVGRLRGVPRGRWLRSVLTEPLLAILVGLPLGFLAGSAVGRLGADLVLRPGTPVEPWRWPVVAAAVATTVVAVAALVGVTLPSIRRPLAELVQQESESRRLTTAGAVVHAGVFLLAAATIYQLVTGGRLSSSGPQLGLLAPGLFALAVALGAVRLAVVVVRRVTTRPPRGLASLVVGRHAARTPSSLNPAMVIAVGVALAVFASQVLVFSERNQGLRADAVTGASTVLGVSVAPGADLLTAVRAADPDGRQAMAVQQSAVVASNGAARILAVDSPRLAAVSSWSPDWAGVDDLAPALTAGQREPVVLRGERVDVELADLELLPLQLPPSAPRDAVYPPPPPDLALTVEAQGRWQTVRLGPLERSAREQRLTAALPCAAGCRLVSIGLAAGANAPYRATLTVTGVGTDVQPVADSAAWLALDQGWHEQTANDTQPEPTAMATPAASPDGLALVAFDEQGGSVTAVSPGDTVDPLPALLGPTTSLTPVPGRVGAVNGIGLDGQDQRLTVLGTAAVLPRWLDDGVLVDLGAARTLSDPAASQMVDQVWLAPGASPQLEERLAENGVRVQSRELLSTTREALEQQATTRGAAVAVVISVAALALSLLALVAARWTDAGRRRTDWRALREGGVSPRRLRRLARTEIAAPAVLAVVVGLLAGAAAARVAGSRLPLVDADAPGPPLDLQLAWWPVLLLGAGAVLVIAVVAQVGALAEVRAEEDR
ncbi:FtsX-like permease family protein [Microlunatus capsulatus]|uniref:Heme exporter protein D n=1 Tax=Microlunatus capsulatus TaxID=99117 RepID=A0ABS4Z2Z3_9ACTN|nr:FtsX-like permease family protein [Microlunatus capsulatus]MBP2415349.1 heme exporter protein D [Microlunatus capsulatus]